jgi:20S proteasome alpha/beta subunit
MAAANHMRWDHGQERNIGVLRLRLSLHSGGSWKRPCCRDIGKCFITYREVRSIDPSLTLVAYFQGKDGVVIASDSRGTIGDPRGLTAVNDFQKKLFQLGRYCGVATYGSAELAAQMISEIRSAISGKPESVSQILESARPVMMSRHGGWFPSIPFEKRPFIGFILAGLENDGSPRAYYLSSSLEFAPQLVTAGYALGGVPQYATYLVHRLYDPNMSKRQLAALAVYTVTETATQDPKVGGPVRVAEIDLEQGYKEIPESDIQEIMKRNHTLNERLRGFFFE